MVNAVGVEPTTSSALKKCSSAELSVHHGRLFRCSLPEAVFIAAKCRLNRQNDIFCCEDFNGLVGQTGFEPVISPSQAERAAKLRYCPNNKVLRIVIIFFFNFVWSTITLATLFLRRPFNYYIIFYLIYQVYFAKDLMNALVLSIICDSWFSKVLIIAISLISMCLISFRSFAIAL